VGKEGHGINRCWETKWTEPSPNEEICKCCSRDESWSFEFYFAFGNSERGVYDGNHVFCSNNISSLRTRLSS
jgi:hypothetical protein